MRTLIKSTAIVTVFLSIFSFQVHADENFSSDWFSKDVSIKYLGDIDSAEISRLKSNSCVIMDVQIVGQDKPHSICPVAAKFGWLDGEGYLRLSDDTKFRRVKPPEGTYLLAQQNSDRVFVIDKYTIYSQSIILRYYDDFSAHLNSSSAGIVLDSDYKTVQIEQLDHQSPRQPLVISLVQNDKVLVLYDKYIAWVDLISGSSGYIGSMPMVGSLYMAPTGQTLTLDGRTAAVTGFQSDLLLYKTYSCNSEGREYSCGQRNLTDLLRPMQPELLSLAPIRFIGNSELQAVATLTDGPPKLYSFSISQQPRQPYMAMGDSFASGEGAFDYIFGTDEVNNKCHNSWLAYPYLIDSSALSVACSGAVINDINGSNLPQYTGDSLLPGQLNQLDFLNYYYPQSASLGVGGNDIGFAQIIKACIDPIDHWKFRPTCYPTAKDRQELTNLIDDQYLRLVDLYKKALQITPKLYVIGYPQIISPNGSCAVNVLLNDSERQFAVWLTDYLNWTISQAAEQAGAVYINVAEALAGHRLCESSVVAVNGVTAGNDTLNIFGRNWLGHESFHPNAYGHQLMAIKIQKALAEGNKPSEVEKPKPMISMPSNEIITDSRYNQSISSDYIHINTPFTVVQKSTFKPLSHVEITVGDNDKSLASVLSDESGSIYADLRFQENAIDSGYHKLHLIGANKYGEPIDVYKIIYLDSELKNNELKAGRVYLSFDCNSTLDLPGLR